MSGYTGEPSRDEEEHGPDSGLAMPGAITYLHIPATDVRQAAAFYRDVFGWHINNPASGCDRGLGRGDGAIAKRLGPRARIAKRHAARGRRRRALPSGTRGGKTRTNQCYSRGRHGAGDP